MRRLFFSHGDKGGAGKSTVSALLVDYLLLNGHSVGLMEGDLQADVADRFADDIKVTVVNLNRSGAAEEAVLAFSDGLADLADCDDIVVNLPSGAGDTLESFAEPIVAVAEAMGIDVYVLFSLGHQAPATRFALRSLDGGLLGSVPVEHRCIIYPGFMGEPKSFDWVLSGARSKAGGAREIVIPAIKPAEFVIKVLRHQGRFSDMVQKDYPHLTLMEKALLQSKFLKPAYEAISVFDKEVEK
jgi:hypothetical protein